MQADHLAARLDDPPPWLGDFVAHLAARNCVARTCTMVTMLGRLLTDGGSTHPQAVLERSRRPGRSMGSLAKGLQDFFVSRGLAVPVDQRERLAAGRRQRRLEAVPVTLRPAVARFVEWSLHNRERARRAGTNPRSDVTIEAHLTAVRDFALFLTNQHRIEDWANVNLHHVEAFIASKPGMRRTRLCALRPFFRWARVQRIVLVDPTRTLTAKEPRAFRGATLTLPEQRALFRRWAAGATAAEPVIPETAQEPVHPHEALVGMLALLHGASPQEMRALTLADINPAARAVHFAGRPHPTPLDPISWTVVERALAHRASLLTSNPHLLVTKCTKATSVEVSPAYLTHSLDRAGVAPKVLRGTRLLQLTCDLDPKLVAVAFGMTSEAVLPYLADGVDVDRLPPADVESARTC